MIKIKTLSIMLGALLGFTSLSQPSLAMEDNKDNIHKISSKVNFTDEDEEYKKAISVIKEKRKDYKKLQEDNIILKNAIRETDQLVTDILNAPITVFSYLSAVARRASSEEREKLFKEATNDLTIPNVIVKGTTSVKNNAFESNVRVLEVSKLLEHTTVSEKYATITYSTVFIKGTPSKNVKDQSECVEKTMGRIEENLYSPSKFNNTKLKKPENTIAQLTNLGSEEVKQEEVNPVKVLFAETKNKNEEKK